MVRQGYIEYPEEARHIKQYQARCDACGVHTIVKIPVIKKGKIVSWDFLVFRPVSS